ncbi:MAG: alpha-galactosidase D [Terriglobia bacterium]
MMKQRVAWIARLMVPAAIALIALSVCGYRSISAAPLDAASTPDTQAEQQSAAKQISVPHPPMGWNSWNSFSNTVDSNIVVQQAKAMIASGMQAVGYQYVLIDEGWWLGERDKSGNIVVDPKQWPALAPGEKSGDMANIARYLHGLNFKAGIYTDAGKFGCSYAGPDLGPRRPNTGSKGHYDQDFLQFAEWGFDYVKVDWCGGDHEHLDPAIQYAEIARAIAKAKAETGHQLFFSICDWGNQSPWTWAPGIGGVTADIWRTGGDISAPIVAGTVNANRRVSSHNVFVSFDRGIHPEAQHTGYYNDLDMMVLGMPGMSDAANRLHMSLWAIAGAPLIVGADVTKLSKTDLATVTNREVLAVDQDTLGLQCVKVAEPRTGLQVWAKPMAASGERALVLLNRTGRNAPISVHWSELGLQPSSKATVRDLWAHKNLGSYTDSYTGNVPADDVVMLMIAGVAGEATRYEASSSASVFVGGAAPDACQGCPGGKSVLIGSERSLVFKSVRSTGKFAYIKVAYINGGSTTVVAELQVNGQSPTHVAFPPTSDENTVGTVTVEASLIRSGENSLTFSCPCNAGIALDSVSLSSW